MTLTSIDVDFSEPVRHDTAQNAFSISPSVAVTFYWQGQKMIVTPTDELPLSTAFKVHMAAGVEDLAGNSQGNTNELDFTTVGAPSIASVAPAPGQRSVSVDASITLTFDRMMDTQKVLEGLTLKPDITYQASWNGMVLTLDPTESMAYGTTYTMQIGEPAVDTDGTPFPPYSTTFTTVGIGLRVTSMVPAANVAGVSVHSQIAVMFDAPIDPSTVGGAISITPPVSGSYKAIALPDDSAQVNPASGSPAISASSVLVFTPSGALAPHTTYSVTLNSTVKRTDGEVAQSLNWQFTTGDPPTEALNQIAFISHRSGVDNVWLMNPDGSNQREITSELVPVSGYDISGDGTTIAYAAGGVVKKMSIDGGSLTTLTSGGNFEYAPTMTPDGTGLIVGRRAPNGLDIGYWRYPLTGSGDAKQVSPDGAPVLGSVKLPNNGLTGQPGMSVWAPRAAMTSDGSTMLVVRGSDGDVEIVDLTGANKPLKLSLIGDSRPVWVQSDGAFLSGRLPGPGRHVGVLEGRTLGRDDQLRRGPQRYVRHGQRPGRDHRGQRRHRPPFLCGRGRSVAPDPDQRARLQRGRAVPLAGWQGDRVRSGRVGFDGYLGGDLDGQHRRHGPDQPFHGWSLAQLGAVAAPPPPERGDAARSTAWRWARGPNVPGSRAKKPRFDCRECIFEGLSAV